MRTRKLDPKDKHVTRGELLAQLQVLVRSIEARLEAFEAEMRDPDWRGTDDPSKAACEEAFVGYTIPTDSEGAE